MKDLVKAKIISLVPEIASRPKYLQWLNPKKSPAIGEKVVILLQDVLLALVQTDSLMHLREVFGEISMKWDLRSDYDGQTQEVKDFIGKLIKAV